MASWPTSLQARVLQGATADFCAPGIATQMDVGPAFQRPGNAPSVPKWQAEIVADAADVSTFQTFWNTTLKNGTDEFNWVDPASGDSATCRMVSDQRPKLVHVAAGLWRIQFQFEVT